MHTYSEDRADHDAVEPLQAPLVRLGERDRKLLGGSREVVSEAHGGELEATEQPHERVGGNTVLLLRVCRLVMGKERLESSSFGRVCEEVGAYLLGGTLASAMRLPYPR